MTETSCLSVCLCVRIFISETTCLFVFSYVCTKIYRENLMLVCRKLNINPNLHETQAELYRFSQYLPCVKETGIKYINLLKIYNFHL